MSDIKEKILIFKKIYTKLKPIEIENWKAKFSIEYTHNSTAIEGNTCSLIETKMILDDKIAPAEKPLKEIDEIRNHDRAFEFVKEKSLLKNEITENLIKDIHERVLPSPGIGGIYRDTAVYIKGAYHVPPNPRKVRELMKFFESDISSFKGNVIEKAAWIHAEFVKIHPFSDGNGRTARLLMNYHLMCNDYPPTIIKKGNVKEYFEALEKYSTKGNLKDFVNLLQTNFEKELDEFIKQYQYHLEELEIIENKIIENKKNNDVDLSKYQSPKEAYESFFSKNKETEINQEEFIATLIKNGKSKEFVQTALENSCFFEKDTKIDALLKSRKKVIEVIQKLDLNKYLSKVNEK